MFVLCLSFIGCATVPPYIVRTNELVTESLEELRKQHRETIKAFAEAMRANIDVWYERYVIPKGIQQYKTDEGISGKLSDEQVAELIKGFIIKRDEQLKEINEHEKELISTLEHNCQTVISANSSVSECLSSIVKLKEKQRILLDKTIKTLKIKSNDETVKKVTEFIFK